MTTFPPNPFRRAQIEIMGLVIIVLLVSVGFLFLLSFQSRPSTQSPNPARTYDDQQLSTNFLAAALKTNVCRQYTVEDLIVACGTGTDQACPTGFLSATGTPACDQVGTAIGLMLGSSLDTWGTRYRLAITYPDPATPAFNIEHNCTSTAAQYATIPFPIPIYRTGQNIIVTMSVCK